MADTRPTQITFFQAVRLCSLLLFAPERFVEEEQRDVAARNGYTDQADAPCRSTVVRLAFFRSLALVVASSAAGFAIGRALSFFGLCATGEIITWVQIFGTSLLLWGTLFVRGWEIQSFAGVLLTERVNQWLYRALYCAGTAVLVLSLAWPLCRQ